MRYYGTFMRSRASSGTVQLLDATYYRSRFEPNAAVALFGILATGAITKNGTPTPAEAGAYNWLTGGSASDYQVRATMTSGAFTAGTAGSWIDCSSSPQWSVTVTAEDIDTATALFEIRRVSDSTVVADATITLTAQVFS